MSRITKTYTDFDAVFKPNPVSGDISVRKHNAAIAFAIKSLVLTRNFERPFQSSIGSQAYRLLFEPMDDVTRITLSQAITQAITNHEPRIDVFDVKVNLIEADLVCIITITYVIKNTTTPVTINIALERTR